jgi:hypothetical protein
MYVPLINANGIHVHCALSSIGWLVLIDSLAHAISEVRNEC